MDFKEKPKRIFISGHRNPDIDSIMSAYALAELRRRRNPDTEFIPICPGVLPERAAFLFRRFNVTPPEIRHDVFLRMRDLVRPTPVIEAGTPLFDAVNRLRESGMLQLPVIDSDGKYLGMLSSVALLSQLLNITGGDAECFTGRRIFSSIEMICRVLDAEIVTEREKALKQDFDVYVAAMHSDSFASHVPVERKDNLAVIVGDRPHIYENALNLRIRLLIVTNPRELTKEFVSRAREQGVSVIRTQLDSASVIRRLKFSIPVEHTNIEAENTLTLSPDDRLRDHRKRILRAATEIVPVLSHESIFLGSLYKKQLSEPSPHGMILVDHNEPLQYLPGVDELPVLEVVDHHRISMFCSENPIRFTGDVVGSTCTLVARMFQSENETLSPQLAGLLLGGLVADTLQLKSPTTSDLDRRICSWLEGLCKVSAEQLMQEMLKIGSALMSRSANDVISGDRKDYTDGRYKFALAQVEEPDLSLLRARKQELVAQMKFRLEVENLSFFALLVTDAVHEISELLIVGDSEVIRALPHEQVEESIFSLPGVLSRKKQLLPQILSICSALQRD